MHAVEYLLELKGYTCRADLIHKLNGRKKELTLELFIPDSQPAFATGKIPTTRAPRINSLFYDVSLSDGQFQE
jgi:hypothetical protein